MNANINIQPKNFIVTIDGEVSKELSQITRLPRTLDRVYTGVQLQAEMLMYDLLHGTNYRRIRNTLARQERNRRFEARLGLEPVGKK